MLRQPWTEVETDSEDAKIQEAAAQAAAFLSLLGGETKKPKEEPNFFEREGFEDFRLWRVVLGYGIPTFAALALATMIFCLRDL